METILKPVAHNERSYYVTLLHQVLAAFGLPVSKTEITQGKAGKDTARQVRALLVKLKVPVSRTGVLNEAAAVSISEALKKRGFLAASRSFTVTGTVRLSTGEVKKRQQLLAFDLDLIGVAVYRAVKNVSEIKKNGGFEFLGRAVSGNKGNYSITFYDWQCRAAERKKADVVVYAVEGETITGFSRMVNSEDYSDKGLVRDLEVTIVSEDTKTEYEKLMNPLNVFLKESGTSLGIIAESSDQLVFIASELDADLSHVTIAANAELIAKQDKRLSHEMLYGIGRQNINLSCAVLSKKPEQELREAVTKSAEERIIREFSEREVAAFVHALQETCAKNVLNADANEVNTLKSMLANALPLEKQQVSLVNALANFSGTDFREFWKTYLPSQPEFKDNPGLVTALLLTQQITLLTGNHQTLVSELQKNRQITSMQQLIDLDTSEWLKIIEKTGVPDFIKGENDDEKRNTYADLMQGLLNAAFPTLRIAKMLEKNQLPIEGRVSATIRIFLSNNPKFDFAGSRVHDFENEIKAAAPNTAGELRTELMKLQRVFQVSTTPGAMTVLLEKRLHSAYTIANIPLKSFIKTYGEALGGEKAAFAIHQRAGHLSTRAEMTAMHLMEYSHGVTPEYALGEPERETAMTLLKKNIPNYSELFGSPDFCECADCRSNHSAAAYLVDLLRFLSNGNPNSDGKSPLDVLTNRRPDLLHLPLTCENTNIIIPYIDMVNEVMECYTVNSSIADFKGYDTGRTTAEELRANPQNFDLEAYRILSNNKDEKKVVYPFTLPYHQPLDVIRTYCGHLKVSREEIMRAMNPEPDPFTARAIEAESLGLSEEEYVIITGENFDGPPAETTETCRYFGYEDAAAFENMQKEPGADGKPKGVIGLLNRAGLKYAELVELVKTQFINPSQRALDFIQRIFFRSELTADTIYAKLKEIKDGMSVDAEISAALEAYNAGWENGITVEDFQQWVIDHFDEFSRTLTLYEPDSKCCLGTTELRTIQSIYENLASTGIPDSAWSRLHRFVRLWRKLGWSIHELDLALAAMGEDDIAPQTIGKLSSFLLLSKATKLPLDQLAVLWGSIDTYGNKSLYGKLFLSKTVQQLDEVFKPDAWDSYLQREFDEHGDPITLEKHQAAIPAAFKIMKEDLDAIFEHAKVIQGGNPRPIDISTDVLNIQNLSIICRYVVLAKALKMRVPDLCKLISLFNASPFSTWDFDQEKFTSISPNDTYEFWKLVGRIKETGFKPAVLDYILQGILPADSRIGLNKDSILPAAKEVRDAFAAIERDHPDTPDFPLTPEILSAKLSLTFSPEIAGRLVDIVKGTASFQTITDSNLDIAIPDALADKFSYVKASGRLACAGVMTEGERDALKDLANDHFSAAVLELYAEPETFIRTQFDDIFADLPEAITILLDRPLAAAALEEKLKYVYDAFLPRLKTKLRRDAVIQRVASLIGLGREATARLIAEDIDALVTDLSTAGFSATYYGDPDWNNALSEVTDPAIDFSWGDGAPDMVPAGDDFSARWQAYIAAPASGEYTLAVEAEEADEIFNLYLDGGLICEKAAGDTVLCKEAIAGLNASRMHLLKLEYAETAQNAGVRLYWKRAVAGREIIPVSAAYPAAILDRFVEKVSIYHRAAKFISGFKISETELAHFIAYKADFGDIDFKALKANDWIRISGYTALRNSLPQAQALLTDVFAAAHTADPAPTVNDLSGKLILATGWDKAVLDYLVNVYFTLGVDGFKNEIALNRLSTVMKLISKTGLSPEMPAALGTAETDFYLLHQAAQSLKNAVRAKYEEEQWLNVAANLNNILRENQKQALISHLLTYEPIQTWGAKDADGLFEYFLIDVQMGACMDTSRIVQAHAAVQMFVNRCLLNLESGVSPAAIDKDRWEWMKNFRVWEANRKVFLWPENWLEPEWRSNRSGFFRELESYLVQNDITDRTVEQAFRNYLASLNEVANLEVCGMYRENDDDGSMKCLHVFGRTHNAPYKFFYRTWNKHGKWSAWEKVQVDIRCVENGDKSGVHLIPVVWKKRLFLFWPEFMEKLEPLTDIGKSFNSLAEDPNPIPQLQPRKYWEIRLAWSEYVDKRWSPKQISKEYIQQDLIDFIPDESMMRFATKIDSEGKLSIYLVTDASGITITPYSNLSPISNGIGELHVMDLHKTFELSDIASKVEADKMVAVSHGKWDLKYVPSFMALSSASKLELLNDVYFDASIPHKLLLGHGIENYPLSFDTPFFFMDAYRTYFVRPETILISGRFKNPDQYAPYIPLTPIASNPDAATGAELLLRTGGTKRETNYAPGRTTQSLSSVTMVSEAFGAVSAEQPEVLHPEFWMRYGKGLEFHTFHHPYSSLYVENLNRRGLSGGSKLIPDYSPGLMDSDTEIPSDEGALFVETYDPNFANGFVQPKPANLADRTYYKQNVCFDVYGANSLYNWELFFHAPLYIATRLSKNGKYEEAMKWFHYIFDPTTDEEPVEGSETSRCWKVSPFRKKFEESLEDLFRALNNETDSSSEGYNPISKYFQQVSEWRDNPFDPHLVASNRPLAYMKNVVIKYVENLLAWGDSLFRQFTRESVNQALQIYVIANHILGPRPEFVPKRGKIKAESYDSLKDKWDVFSNALVELENIFPYSSAVPVTVLSTGSSMLGTGSSFYFCIPQNEKLLEYWDTAADRLFKIRHCMDIDGKERKLALFSPPISPDALIQAQSQGLSLGSILTYLSSPPPIYRFSHLIQKANEFCAEVRGFGAGLLSALEKKDGEELGRLRAAQETNMLELVTAIKERQVLDAKANKENLLKARETAAFRMQHYLDLLGNDSPAVPAEPTIDATLTADSQLPVDTSIATIQTDVDESLVDGDEAGVKLIPREKEDIDKSLSAIWWQGGASAGEALAGLLSLLPDISIDAQPFGIGFAATLGGSHMGTAASAASKVVQLIGSVYAYQAGQAAKMSGYIRREQDWTLQANLAAREIIQLDKQITSADIRIQVAEKELENHKQQIENSRAVELFLKDKFTNQELYHWMKEQLFTVYQQSYNLAFDMAKKAEKAYAYERGTETADFIQYGYWDDAKQGLVAGEKLQLALKQLEKSYLEENRRELELTKSVSLALLDPLALIQLREKGACYVTLPEELFDLDFHGHYFRRIKSVSISLPCVAGPYTTVNCSLRLLNNATRINTLPNSDSAYEHENADGLWIDDDRFRTSNVPVTSIATSHGQNDAGLFEFNFRDERYLPFEGAGAISEWQIELSTAKELRQFDYSTISDVILHLKYTAREGSREFKESVLDYIINRFITNYTELTNQPFMRMFSMKHEFPTEWHKFQQPVAEGGAGLQSFTIGKKRFPFFVQDKDVVIMKIEVFAKCLQEGDPGLVLTYIDINGESVTSSEIAMPYDGSYDLNKATIHTNDARPDITREMNLSLAAAEVEDIFLIMHYKLENGEEN